MSALYVDAGFLKAEVSRLIEHYPDLAEDETLRADMLEAETDLHKIVERVLSERRTAETMATAIKERETDLATRRGRFEKKAEAMRSLIKSVMQSAELDKLTLAEATLSIQKPRTSVSVTALDELPQGYYRVERKADKTAIKKSLENGEAIPGAELVLGDETLTVRVK